MSQIEDLQGRIARALDRIGHGIDNVVPATKAEEIESLRLRAEVAEQALAQAQEALAATRDHAAAELEAAVAAAVEAARLEASAELARALEQAQADPSPPVAGADDDVAALRDALEDEKTANAQLEERLRVLKLRIAEAESAGAGQTSDGLAELDAELQRLRAANQQLTVSNASLREANAQGLGEPELINEGLMAELAGLRAARAAEAAEAHAVLGALEPLLAQAAKEGTR
jgi:DNA repair exonuclease SbcCD ATPase subunit